MSDGDEQELAEVIDMADYRLAKFKSQLNLDADFRAVFPDSWWPESAARASHLTKEDLDRLLHHYGVGEASLPLGPQQG